jgi:thioredoxin-dependent peroxiredoxin
VVVPLTPILARGGRESKDTIAQNELCIRSTREVPLMQKRQDAVKFKGTPKTLVGPQLKAGDQAPDFACLSQGLETITLGSTPSGKVRVFSVVPSLDTPVCSTQTKKFEETLGALKDKVAAYTISLDLPFAQKRFCGAENIANMQTLSDVHNQSFGQNYGVLLEGLPLALLTRAVFVVGKDNKITYVEYVPEVTSEPNYDAAVAAVKAAAG